MICISSIVLSAMVRIRGEKCPISTDGHLLEGEGVVITNPKLLEFARKRRMDFRKESRVCAKCAKGLEKIYEYKLRRAIEKKKQLKSLTVSSSSSLDDFDRMVYQTPRTKHLRVVVKENAPFQLRVPSQDMVDVGRDENQDNNVRGEDADNVPALTSMIVSDESSVMSTDLGPAGTPPSPGAFEVISISLDNSQNSSLDVRPSTSEAAVAALAANQNDKDVATKPTGKARQGEDVEIVAWRKPLEPVKRKRVNFKNDKAVAYYTALQYGMTGHLRASSTDEDDNNDEFMPSMNALNGTRLPHVQPIPKRRKFRNVVPTVKDSYTKGITGG